MTLQERISRLIAYDLQNNVDISTPKFKIELEKLFYLHCDLEHLTGKERLEAKEYTDKVWYYISSGKFQIEYITQNRIILPPV